MKEDAFCYRVTLFFTFNLIVYWIGTVRADHFTTTPIYNIENQIIDSFRKQTSTRYSPHQSSIIKNQAMNFKMKKSLNDGGNNSRNEYLNSTRKTTFMGYGLFVKSDYLRNFTYSTTGTVNNFKTSYSAENSQNISSNSNYSTQKASIKSNLDFQKNKESQIEKYQAISTENKNYNNDHHADRIKYLIMGDENPMKISKANSSQNSIAISSLAPYSSYKRKEQDLNRLQVPSNLSKTPTNTMIVDQHTRIMLQMNHGVNNNRLLNSYEKKENFESLFNNYTKQAFNNSIDSNTRAGQKNLILDINNIFGKNESHSHDINHGENSRFMYQDHVRRPQSSSHEINKVHSFSKFEPYSDSQLNSNAMNECKSCRINSQQIYSPMTNHMRDRDVIGNGVGSFFNKNTNSGQGNIVPMNDIIRNSQQGWNPPRGFKVNTALNQQDVVNNPTKYDALSSNSMNVNKFELGVGMNPNLMTSNRIKTVADMKPHPMQPNTHDMNSFVMQNSYNKQESAIVSQGSMKQNMSFNGNGYSYNPPNSHHVNAHDQSISHGTKNVNGEHMMKPYKYKIPNNDMMLKPHVDIHSQHYDEKEYMEHVIKHHNHEVQDSMLSKPHKDSEKQNNDEKEHMQGYNYDVTNNMKAKPHVEAHGQYGLEKGSFMEQMMMLMMMKLGDHMAPNNVINFHVGPDKHSSEHDKIKMEPMMKFNRIHPMHPMHPMHRATSVVPDKKEDEKYVVVKMPAKQEPGMHPGHDKKEDEKYVLVKMPGKPEPIISDHSYIPYDPTGWMSGWYTGIVFPDKKKIFTVIFLIVVVILTKKLLLALAVIKFFLAIVPVLAFILLLKQYLFYFLITKGFKFFKWFKKIPLFFAVSPLFFFPIIIPFFYLCKGGESSSTEYTITYPTFTYPTFTFPTFTFPTFTFPTFPTNPETTGRTETLTMPPTTQTLTTTTTMTTPTTITTMSTMVTTMTETMSMNTESMATQPMSMATQPMSMASPSMSMESPSMSMESPPMSMATQPMTMSGRIGVLKPTKRPVSKSTVAMKIVGNVVRVKHTKLPALTQYKNDINSYTINIGSTMKKTTPMFQAASTRKKLSTVTYQNIKHPVRWHRVTKKPQPTTSMDKLVTNKQKTSIYNKNCGGSYKHCEGIKKKNQPTSGVKVKDQKYKQKNSSLNYSKSPLKIGSPQNKIKPVFMKNMISNRDKQKLKTVLRDWAIVKTANLNKGGSRKEKSKKVENQNRLEDLSNGIEVLRERFPRQSSSFLSLFNRMWSALASDRCMERIGCHLAVNSKRVSNYNSMMIRVLQSLFSIRANRRIRSYIKAYQLGSKKEGSHFTCRYLFPCLGILKI